LQLVADDGNSGLRRVYRFYDAHDAFKKVDEIGAQRFAVKLAVWVARERVGTHIDV
jgi:hypothetical protein